MVALTEDTVEKVWPSDLLKFGEAVSIDEYLSPGPVLRLCLSGTSVPECLIFKTIFLIKNMLLRSSTIISNFKGSFSVQCAPLKNLIYHLKKKNLCFSSDM